jgi:mono/diheme cytochrome c family protein
VFPKATRLLAAATLFSTALLSGVPVQPTVVSAAEPQNSAEDKPAKVKEGASLFRANCSPCHGLSARGGGRGPDLTSGH